MGAPRLVRLSLLLCLPVFVACDRSPLPGAQALAAQGSSQVYLKVDFDQGQNPIAPTDVARADLVGADEGALSGRSLRVSRAKEGRFIGVSTPLRIVGARDLRIAFVVKAAAMQWVSVNAFDQRRQDNTTPASPARIFDGDWHPVVFAAEDFHYNSGQPDQKIDLASDFASLLFHGREGGQAAEMWIDKLVVYRGHDDMPPDPPSEVRAASAQDGSVEITWREPSDNTFAVVYSIQRRSGAGRWQKVGESLRPTYRDRPDQPGAYTYRVEAADYDNNVSAPSGEATVTITAASSGRPAPAPAAWEADRAIYADHVRQVHARGAGTVRPDVFLFAGDSITAAALYTHTLGSWLARGLTVRRGVGTVTTAYGASNIKSYLQEARPEFAIVMYGTNDQERGVSTSTAMDNLGAIIDACVQFGTVPVVATIPPRGYDKRAQQPQERFSRAIADLGRRKRVPVSYVFDEMMRGDLRQMLFDGIHLQPEAGNDAAGRALRRTMDQVYFALRDTTGG